MFWATGRAVNFRFRVWGLGLLKLYGWPKSPNLKPADFVTGPRDLEEKADARNARIQYLTEHFGVKGFRDPLIHDEVHNLAALFNASIARGLTSGGKKRMLLTPTRAKCGDVVEIKDFERITGSQDERPVTVCNTIPGREELPARCGRRVLHLVCRSRYPLRGSRRSRWCLRFFVRRRLLPEMWGFKAWRVM